MYRSSEHGLLNRKNGMSVQMMIAGILAIGLCAGAALAQGDPDFGIDFVTIGDPGNRNPEGDERLYPYGPPRGSIAYEYRVSKYEITTREHLEFAIAYAPIYFKNHPEEFIAAIQFSGTYLLIDRGQVALRGTNLNRATNIGWEYLARYVNWLHHGKVVEEWAFESGVYDLSTFVERDDEDWAPQPTRNDGSRYWIPSQGEWDKAAHWDPNKVSDGVGGYWLYPNKTDQPLLPNLLPSEGGQRNAGEDRSIFPLSVGSYPEQESPWGLLDIAGGESEWTEKLIPSSRGNHARGRMGSVWQDTFYNEPFSEYEHDLDRLGIGLGSGVFAFFGARVATGMFGAADLNRDGVVNYFDISMFISGVITGDPQADLRLDGIYDIDDIRVFLGLLEIER